MDKKFYLGLDIGTASVGWALTDENYELVHLRGKSAWGVHLFEEAKTAEKRRLFRSARRRKARTKRRINLLQELFSEEIAKIDPLFFIRLNNSTFFADDKDTALLGKKDTLFSDRNFTDKDFHKLYKTIYHLQKELIDDKNTKFDIRFIYLALHHLIKYRGHFYLEESLNMDEFGIHQIKEGFEKLQVFFEDEEEIKNLFNKANRDGFYSIVEKVRGVNNTKKALKDLFATKNKIVNNTLEFIASGSSTVGRLFPFLEFGEEDEKKKINFGDEEFENQYYEIEGMVGEEKIILIDAAKQLYDYIIIARLMDGEKFIAHSMVKKYNKHRDDLKRLKKIIKKACGQEEYNAFFKDNVKTVNNKPKRVTDNYPAYIGMTKIKGVKQSVKKITKADEINKFYNRIKKLISNVHTPEADKIREEIEKGVFLPKITSVDNAKIPNQFFEYQVSKILDNAAKHYPFLNKVDGELSIKDKILKILTFRIPYYVGPLSDINNLNSKEGGFSWVVRKTNETVLPWNLDKVIDLDKTAEQFILNMTNKCSYLLGEDVIPKQSLLYEEYNMLNHLNVIKVNEKFLSKDEKDELIENVAKKRVTVTQKAINNYFARRLKKDVTISGFDIDAKFSLSSYHKLNRIFPGRINNEPQNARLIRNLERVILLGTIYSSPTDFAKRVTTNKQFREFFTEEELKKLSRLRFSGWGNFSRLLLAGYDSTSKKERLNQSLTYKDEKTGNELSIIEIMREEPLNFNQALFDEKYNFNEIIKRFNDNKDETLDVDELIDSYYLSPAVKRSIKRTIKIVDEVIQVNEGIVPDKIFVEVTRENEAKTKGKGRTISRLNKLRDIYKKAIKDADEFRELAKELENENLDDSYLSPKKVYLYYLQNGKCAYSGEPLDLLSSDIDIDHIVPRCLVKDDSFDNLVLVKKEENNKKGDHYPIRTDVIRRQKPFWKQLKKLGLMSNAKYEKLTRTRELTAEDFQGFINRQLVITNQANKAVAEILKKLYGNATIVYSKASNVTNFRNQFNITKCREINNVHHAHDAYLNVVVGNYFHTLFGSRYYFSKDNDEEPWSPKTAFKYTVKGCWDKDRSLVTVMKMLKRQDVLFTRMPEIRSGEFYDQTASKAAENLLPIKESGPLTNTARYGGYSGKNAAYFTIIEHTNKKNKRERIFISMPIIINQKIKQGQTTFKEYLKNDLKLVKPKVIYPLIPFNTVIKRGKSLQFLSGYKGEFSQVYLRNMIEPYFDNFTYEYLTLIYKYFEQKSLKGKKKKKDETSEVIISEDQENQEEVQQIKEIQVIFSKDEERLRFINFKKNKKVFEKLIEKIKKPIYKKSHTERRIKIINNKNEFYKLSLERQTEIIISLHKLLKTGVPGRNDIDLAEFGVKTGELTASYKIEDMSIVKQSITGLYQKEIIIKQV